jgi:hypothetical protein
MKNCCTDPGPEPRKIPTAEVGRTLQSSIDGTDPLRAQQLGGLQTMRQVKGASLEREHARLSGTLGSSHPEVAALSRKIELNQTVAVQVKRAQARSEAAAPRADADTWTVHGHVRTKDFAPVAEVTVALYTCEGQWLRQFGYACTDANGYYKLTAKAGETKTGETKAGKTNASAANASEMKAGEKAGDKQSELSAFNAKSMQSANLPGTPPADAAPRATADYSTNASRTASARQACLNVTDSKQMLLGGDNSPLTPQLGRVDYREIILDGTVCAPPPDGTPQPAPEGAPGRTRKTRFLGNSGNREVHDLENTKKNCRIDKIAADHRVYFKSAEDAVKARYDYCAYCFGKAKSKR